MWEMVRGWMIAVVAAIVLFNLLDLLMPSGGMRKVAAMAAGLVILLMMILPVSGAFANGGLEEGFFELFDAAGGSTQQDTGNNFEQDDEWQVYRNNLIHIDDSKD